jgi:hypothetical protein
LSGTVATIGFRQREPLQKDARPEGLLGPAHDHDGAIETSLFAFRPGAAGDDVGNFRRKALDELGIVIGRRSCGRRDKRNSKERGGAQQGLEHEKPPKL